MSINQLPLTLNKKQKNALMCISLVLLLPFLNWSSLSPIQCNETILQNMILRDSLFHLQLQRQSKIICLPKYLVNSRGVAHLQRQQNKHRLCKLIYRGKIYKSPILANKFEVQPTKSQYTNPKWLNLTQPSTLALPHSHATIL